MQVLIDNILSINLVLRNGKFHLFLYSFLNSRNVVSLPFYSPVTNPHISKIRKSPSHFWTVTKGKTQAVGPSTFSIMSFSSSSISFSNNFCLRLWGIFLGCTRGGLNYLECWIKIFQFSNTIKNVLTSDNSIIYVPRIFKICCINVLSWIELNLFIVPKKYRVVILHLC